MLHQHRIIWKGNLIIYVINIITVCWFSAYCLNGALIICAHAVSMIIPLYLTSSTFILDSLVFCPVPVGGILSRKGCFHLLRRYTIPAFPFPFGEPVRLCDNGIRIYRLTLSFNLMNQSSSLKKSTDLSKNSSILSLFNSQ